MFENWMTSTKMSDIYCPGQFLAWTWRPGCSIFGKTLTGMTSTKMSDIFGPGHFLASQDILKIGHSKMS